MTSTTSTSSSASPSTERWSLLVVIGVACGVILPLLGATGFFDPWETNYAEVAREMVVRDDYLYPFWKDAYFFSKPVLLFWLTAPLYALVGADAPGPMPHSVELLGRLPSALLGIAVVVVGYVVARRFWSRRAAMVGALALATTPMWAFLSRQAITDMPYVSLTSLGLLLLAPTLLHDDDERARLQALPLPRGVLALIAVCVVPQLWQIARTGAFLHRAQNEAVVRVVVGVVVVGAAAAFVWFLAKRARDPLFHAACVCFALSVLAKGPVGVAIAGVVVVVAVAAAFGARAVLALLVHPALVTGLAVFFAVGAPWPLTMLAFDGVDDQRKTWFQRFVLYDLLGRVGAGVHGDRGGVEYYVKYIGVGMLPWSGFVPFAFFDAVSAVRQRMTAGLDQSARFTLYLGVWAFVCFCFFAGTTTKFHHYILPFIVPAAFLVGRFVAAAADHKGAAVVAVALAGVVTILFARDLAAEPWEWIDLFTYHYKGYKPDYYFPVDTLDVIPLPEIGAWKAGETVSLYRVMPLAFGFGFVGVVALALVFVRGRGAIASAFDVDDAPAAGVVVGAVAAAALVAVGAVQVFWARSSQHWSQRWLFETVYSMRQPGDGLIAYQMDWKGETFYGKNTEIQIKKNASDLRAALDRPGRDFVLVQTDRFDSLKAAVGAKNRVTVVDKSNAKWLLVLVE